MPTLDWIGKSAVVNHHNEVPFHLLRCNPELSVGEDSGNLLVEGDNLLALKALLPYYAGQVKCIYIDPPYNTGNEGWVYNDAVNSPEMCDWLGRVVGGEAEDLSRHDKWLCMMYPRLILLRQFLRQDGFIFISIDYNEAHNMRMLLDDIFGSMNFRNWISTRRGTKNVQTQFEEITALSTGHDSLFIYSRSTSYKLPKLQNDLGETQPGKWDTFWRGTDRPTMRYEIFGQTPKKGQWRWEQKRAIRAVTNYQKYLLQYANELSLDDYFVRELQMTGEKLNFVRLSQDNVVQYYVPPRSQKLLSDVWMDLSASGNETDFPTEKPLGLLSRIINWATKPGDIVLDSFAGSGTTGHAVLKQDAEDGGKRRFILVELDANIAQSITAERLRRVIQGYTYRDQKGNEKFEPGLGGGFRYCELGPTLFDSAGTIRSEVSYADLARHVFFTETGQPLPEDSAQSPPLLGSANGAAVYLLYNGVMQDAGNTLTPQILDSLPPFDGPKVIYGDGCRIGGERLRQANAVFKQTPYQVRVR